MNILIVDDEPRHLRGMAGMIRSMRPEARVSVAKDGEEALAVVRSELPDVVLSDIQMPNMDGLAFLKHLEEEGIQTKVVMVSAYNLFEYAQIALRHGAHDYLLKPVDADKVEALLQRLEAQIAVESKQREESEMLKQRVELASSAYRSRLLHLWLSGNLTPRERAELEEWELARTANAILLTEIDRRTGNQDELQPETLHAIARQVEQLGSAFGQAATFALQTAWNQRAQLVTILRLGEPFDQLRQALRGALIAGKQQLLPAGALTHGIGGRQEADPYEIDIMTMHKRAQTALSYAFHDGWQGVVDYDALTVRAKPVFRLDGEQLFEALQEPTMAAAERMCRSAFEELACGGHADPKLMRDYAALTLMKVKSRTRDITDRRIGSVIGDTAVSAIPECSGSGELMELLLDALSCIHTSLNESKQDRSEMIIHTCLSWIQEHYREDLTLEMAAEKFHFNASYFSTLMKSRTGRSFSDHIAEARMRRAKALLMSGQHKIYEISEQCGYRDTKYFTRIFKKQVGLSPEAYKRMAHAQAGNEDAE
ncbi:response regulator [Paenibacillus sp. R14(2021)]|uniref:response regulator n=1 Tax=Paenibacillus sp. R14(2021) TaxID=2859228 RepID=UPI001C611A59|nr:response regulator [Paenibacillus sp. R14(2021)]